MESTIPKLVFDIETIGEDFDSLDKTTQESLTRWIEKEADDEDEYKRLLDDLKTGMGFSALTGSIVAVGVLDADKDKGGVYYQAPLEASRPKAAVAVPPTAAGRLLTGQVPDLKQAREEEDGITYEVMDEERILRKFWEVASKYKIFITFNGRAFDVPFLMTRSAVHKVPPTKNLMSGRYLYQQHADAVHIDLYDQLSFHGTVRRKGGLHLWCRALGIKSPKSEGITGDDVGDLFKKKKYLEIAKYNVGDLHATKELFEVWNTYFNL